VERVVDHYRTRWLSEEFHAALPIACEILALRSGARSDESRPAAEVLPPHLLRALRKISHYPLSKNPTASEALLAVAALGGHLKAQRRPGLEGHISGHDGTDGLRRRVGPPGSIEAGRFVMGRETTTITSAFGSGSM